MKKYIFGIIIGLIIIVLSIVLLKNVFNDYEETYPTYLDAKEMIEHGWIPEFIPEDASEIHLGYDLDTNATLLKFNTNGTDFILESGCTSTEEKASHALNAKWWDDTLYANPDTLFFQCDKNAWMALNGNTIWFWRGIKEITVKDLTKHPKRYITLSGKLVTLTGYVDSANIFDTRINEDRNSFALIPNPEKIGENTVFVEFAHKTDAFALLDELHTKPDDFELTATVTGKLHSFEMPMNFNTATGYELLVFDLADIIFLTADEIP